MYKYSFITFFKSEIHSLKISVLSSHMQIVTLTYMKVLNSERVYQENNRKQFT